MCAKHYKWTSWGLGLFSAILMILLLQSWRQLVSTNRDIRFARELSETFGNYRAKGLRGGVHNAVDALERLHVPEGSDPFSNKIADFVERDRKAAVREIIDYLRAETGEDYGNTPEKWIDALKE